MQRLQGDIGSCSAFFRKIQKLPYIFRASRSEMIWWMLHWFHCSLLSVSLIMTVTGWCVWKKSVSFVYLASLRVPQSVTWSIILFLIVQIWYFTIFIYFTQKQLFSSSYFGCAAGCVIDVIMESTFSYCDRLCRYPSYFRQHVHQ